MNIVYLEYFVAAVRVNSFKQAAGKLFVTPQAVSKGIGSLEKELGITLFEKDGRGVKATGAALAIEPFAVHILDYARQMRSAAEQAAEKGLIANAQTNKFKRLSVDR